MCSILRRLNRLTAVDPMGVSVQRNCSFPRCQYDKGSAAASGTGACAFTMSESTAAGVQLAQNTDSAGKIYLKTVYDSDGVNASIYAYNNALMREQDMVAQTSGKVDMSDAASSDCLTIEKLEAMTCVCSVGLDMIAIPGDTSASTISGLIADEAAIGMVNQKTTAVRVIPVAGKGVGEMANFGGLMGYAPIMPVNQTSCEAFVTRGGRIPAPIHSFKN